MNNRTVGLLRTAVAVGGGLAVAASATLIAIGRAGEWWSNFGALHALFSLFFALFVWFVAAKQPRNAVVWTMAACAFFSGVKVAGRAGALLVISDPNVVLGPAATYVPADLPPLAAGMLMVGEPAFILAFFPLLTFGLLLFPDGRLPSPRWRWVGLLAGVSIAFQTVGSAWSLRPGNTTAGNQGVLFDVGFLTILFTVALCLGALVARFRRSSGATRDRFKWVVWGASVFVPAVVFAALLGGTRYEGVRLVPIMLAGAVFLASYGIAVGRYRLFDIDLVISRTVVVAGLAGFITAVYAAVVGGVGLLFGAGADADLPLSIAATVLVAVAFQPVRDRMHRWANRLVYGQRATPYEVLSRFSARMRDAVTTDELIPQMARLLADGTAATAATVWIRTDDVLRPIAHWPQHDDHPTPATIDPADGRPSVAGVDHLAPVEHDGEMLGAVTVTTPHGEAMTTTEQRLVDDVASQAGLVLRNASLTADLVDTIEQLRSSRQRLVAAQDEERRRLERDLHDGAQQQFIAVKLKAAMAQRLAEQQLGDDDRAARLMAQVVADTDEGVAALRDLAHGIYPPLLEAEGLNAALSARAAKAPVAVSVSSDDLGRHQPEVEAAVYFCVLEAIQNVVKYADAEHATVTLDDTTGQLRFTVNDDGRGFDPDAKAHGRGLSNMTDRLDALGGSLQIRSQPGEGTTVTGSLPVEPDTAPDG